MFRNFFHLYHRTCDLSGKKILSVYDKNVSFPVYEMHDWWGDAWDGLSYGEEVNPSIAFFEQLARLHRTVPRMNLTNVLCENTDYCNMSLQSRNCYLVFGNVSNENCAYGHIVWQSQNCFDCMYTYRSAFCYECIDCVQCHTLSFSRDCDNCSSSSFLVHCTGCRDCFGCVGLKNKEHHIFNEPHSQDVYRSMLAQLNAGSFATIALARERVRELTGKEVVKEYHGFGCENVTGDYLYNCKNIEEGYDLKNCEDCLFCATMESLKDTADCNFSGATNGGELCYHSLSVGGGYRILSCHNCMNACASLTYCDSCYACKDCFGCAGLKNKRHCILNRQYTQKEYERIVPEIVERMRTAGEWGEFFPHAFSPFGYNETIASQYFALTEQDVRGRGWRWKKEEADEEQYLGPDITLPDDVRDVDDAITQKILRCETTGKLYKITPQELKFYREMKLPLPRKCFDQRQKERFAQRNPRHLWSRACAECGKKIQTTYAPERPETVFCERCYLETVY